MVGTVTINYYYIKRIDVPNENTEYLLVTAYEL